MSYDIRSDFQAEVDVRLMELKEDMDDADKQRFITQAVQVVYSKDRPDTAVASVTGSGGFDYLLSTVLFSSWSDGFSVIKAVEYPYDSSSPDPNWLEDEDWTIYQGPAGKYLRFTTSTPAATETIRALYICPYLFSAEAVTIPTSDYYAVCDKAAALCLRATAAKFTASTDSTMQADVVNYRSKGSEALKLAERYDKDYAAHMGIKDGDGPAPATGIKDLDTSYAFGADWLTHPRRWY